MSTPLHVLSEVAMGRPSDSNATQHDHHQQGPQLSNTQSSQANPAQTHTPNTTSSTMTPISDHHDSSANPILNTNNSWPQYVGQNQIDMGLLPSTTGCQSVNHFPPPYDQTQSFVPSDPTATDQQNFWPPGVFPDADLSMALAFHPGMWDDEFFSFSLDGSGF